MKLKLLFKKALVWLIHQIPALFGIFLTVIFVYYFYALSSVVFVGLPKILNSTITALPINNNVYPILLQGLLIIASMIFGFYGILVFYSSKKLNKVIDPYLGKSSVSSFVFKLLSFVLILLPLFLLILSIFFSLNGLTYYGITSTFVAEQINTGHIPVAISNLSVENSTYFNLAKNYSQTAQDYYDKILSNTQSSIKMIFLSTGIISALLVIYLVDIFGGFKYVYEKYNQNKNTRYFIDTLIIILILGIAFYFKAYALVAELIFLIVTGLAITYLIYKKEKRGKGKTK